MGTKPSWTALKSREKSTTRSLGGVLQPFRLAWSFIKAEVGRNPRSYIIGVFTVFLSMLFIAVLQSALSQSGLIFLRIAEKTLSEGDLLVTPLTSEALELGEANHVSEVDIGDGKDRFIINHKTDLRISSSGSMPQYPLLNSTALDISSRMSSHARGSSPRWAFPSNVVLESRSSINASLLPTYTLGIVSRSEEEIRLGRTWADVPPLEKDECYISKELSHILTGSPNEFATHVRLRFNLVKLLETMAPGLGTNGTFLFSNLTEVQQDLDDKYHFRSREVKFKVAYTYVDPDGKWPSPFGDVVVVEFVQLAKRLQPIVVQYLLNVKESPFGVGLKVSKPAKYQELLRAIQYVKQFNAFENALLDYTMFKNRAGIYTEAKQARQRVLSKITADLSNHFGAEFPGSFRIPIHEFLLLSEPLISLLTSFLGVIVFIICVLGSLLIYSLLLSDVEEQTFKLGLLRSLGLKKSTISRLLFLKSGLFSIIGLPLAWLVAFGIFVPIRSLISSYTDFSTEAVGGVPSTAFILTACLGIIVPLLANIIPIRKALASNLRNALDIYHSSSSEMSVHMIRLSEQGVAPWQIGVGLVLVVFGIITFVILPLGFMLSNWTMIMLTLMFVIVGMMLGLISVAALLQIWLQKAVLFCSMPLSRWKAYRHIINKNCAGHRKRNSKTSLMFTISICFVLLSGIIFDVQIQTMINTIRKTNGSDVIIRQSHGIGQDEAQRVFSYFDVSPFVDGYSFAYTSWTIFPEIQSTGVRSQCRESVLPLAIVGLDPNFGNVAYTEYVDISQTSRQPLRDISFQEDVVSGITLPYLYSQPDIRQHQQDVEKLYQDQRKRSNTSRCSVTLSDALRKSESLSLEKPVVVTVSMRDPDSGKTFDYNRLCRIEQFVTSYPVFPMSSFESRAASSFILMPPTDAVSILKSVAEAFKFENSSFVVNGTVQLPISSIFIKLRSNTTSIERKEVRSSIQALLYKDDISIADTADQISDIDGALSMLNMFFYVVGGVSMSFCFVVLLLSASANIRENAWEIGVYRSLGLNTRDIMVVYLMESITLVLSALILGTLIGIAIGICVTLQFDLLGEAVFTFVFPINLFLCLAGIGVITAVLATYIPARAVTRQCISVTVKK